MSETDENRNQGIERRTFLKLAGLSGAGALAGCWSPPAERVFSYVSPPDDQRLGFSTYYASTCQECPAACGILVRTREGRALKVEGNPDHPVNRGTVCSRGQAAVQGLYNPDRVPGVRVKDGDGWGATSWEEAEQQLIDRVTALQNESGAIQFWTGATSGATDELIDDWCAATGAERVTFEPFDYAPIREAARRVFGTGTVPIADLSKAKYILSIGADFLDTWGLPLTQARGYDAAHSAKGGVLAKHVQVESHLSLTGHNADEWISIKPGTEARFALGLAQLVGSGISGHDAAVVAEDCGISEETLRRLAQELLDHTPAVVLGPGVQATGSNATEAWIATFLLNRALGAIGTTLLPSPGFDPGNLSTMREVTAAVERLRNGEVKLLLVHNTNPAYALTGGLDFAGAARNAEFRIAFSTFFDETSSLCDLLLPDHHSLESWGDTEPASGVRGLLQPTMRPVFQTQQTGDVLLKVAQAIGGSAATRMADASFREYLQRRWGGVDRFRAALQRGGALPQEMPSRNVVTRWNASMQVETSLLAGDGDLTLVVYPHPYFYDGRGANRPWLQEIPDPITKIVWDSWCELHPDTAARLGLDKGDTAAVETNVGKVELPVYLNPHQHPDVVAIPIGQGHTAYGQYATDRGINAFDLLGSEVDSTSGGRAFLSKRAKVSRGSMAVRMVQTSPATEQHGRGLAQAIPLTLVQGNGHPGENGHGNGDGHGGGGDHGGGAHGGLVFRNYRDVPGQLDGNHARTPDLADGAIPAVGSNQYNRTNKRWGMTVDLSSCIGCNACVAACYAENNIGIVGKENVIRGREMAWLRIERYYEEAEDGLETRFVPVMCQHCDNAPCETVCPVYATYHNPEGLNVQVYNRCVGTRYCSNNCPYKVRAFNWFDYELPSPLHMQLNPDVTARSKGVMEKCTFCLQRITHARGVARDENRDIRDGEITPACAQTCPTQAIVFGDINDPESRVSQIASGPRGYHIFDELNTRPNVTYLKKVSRRQLLADGGSHAAHGNGDGNGHAGGTEGHGEG